MHSAFPPHPHSPITSTTSAPSQIIVRPSSPSPPQHTSSAGPTTVVMDDDYSGDEDADMHDATTPGPSSSSQTPGTGGSKKKKKKSRPDTRVGPRQKYLHCSRCDAVFDRPSALNLHVLSHTGEKRAWFTFSAILTCWSCLADKVHHCFTCIISFRP
ncbi:hypothetical protein DL93DRAFT_1865638 [Clavulina sp. PMI_390]|nr:hypothetical protein DL93DRAFT_1865638 [Clavulina sp. PMI_390]